MANVACESSFQPGAEQYPDNPNKGGKGLFQWDARRQAMYNYVGSNWKTNVNKQLDFAFIKEWPSEYNPRRLTGTLTAYGYTTHFMTASALKTCANTSDNAYHAAADFAKNWEGCVGSGSNGYDARGKLAREYYNSTYYNNLRKDKAPEPPKPPTPTLDQPTITSSGKTVTITGPSGSTLVYSRNNGSNYHTTANTATFNITATETDRAFAVRPGYNQSPTTLKTVEPGFDFWEFIGGLIEFALFWLFLPISLPLLILEQLLS